MRHRVDLFECGIDVKRLALNLVQQITAYVSDRLRQRYRFVRDQFHHAAQMPGALWNDMPKLEQIPSDRVDELGSLFDHFLSEAKQNRNRLLGFRLRFNKAHIWSQ